VELKFETERLILKTLSEADAPRLLDYFKRNQGFLEVWEVKRTPEFYTVQQMKALIKDDMVGLEAGHTLRLWIFKKDAPQKVIGSVALSNIIRGAFQSAFIGYRLDAKEINRGYMCEAVKKMVELAFNRLKLHRIEANIIPRNIPSRRMIENAGFVYEGLSKKYLRINGVWEDHIHMVILNTSME
jgi:ribosomal-protein-alanine N-acetyltransferase